jgi:hypothetical protein
MQIFTELSANQKDALGKTCKACGKGVYVERNGRYGPWVQCNAWPCKAKVYRPRGSWVSRKTVETGAMVTRPEIMAKVIAKAEVNMKDIEHAVSAIIGTDANQALHKLLEHKLTEHGEKLDAMATRKVDETLRQVEANANAVLSVITEGLVSLKAQTPQVIQIKQLDGSVVTVKDGHYLLPRLIKLIGAGVNVYAWGPAGSGKTTAMFHAARALGIESEIDTLDPTTFRSMIQGYMTPKGEPVHTTFTRCWTDGKLYIGDETDNAPGHVQTLFNSALANGHAPLAWGNVERNAKFGFGGTGNTPGRPTREFPDRKPMSAAFADRLYFMHWPLDPAIECRAGGLPIPPRSEPVAKTCSASEWVTFVRKLREWASVNMPTLMVTPRASLTGLQALALGESPLDVAHGLIFRGADSEMVSKALNAVKLP